MRSILEKALIALLNEDKDQADALFHDFILERSRQIHESLRQGEDLILDENWEQELAIDEMFTEDDLMQDDTVVAEADDEEETTDTEAEAEEGDEAAEEPAMDDAEAETEAEPESIEDRVESLEDELTRLAAEFDALMGDEEVGTDMVAADDELAGDEMDADMAPEVKEGELTITHTTEDGMDDETFESLGESIVDELEAVNVKHAEGMTTSSDKATVNTKSPGMQPKVGDRAFKGEPVEIKAKEHSGYDREAAPKSATIPARKNTLKSAEQGRTSVSKEGDKSAVLNTGTEDKSAQKGLFSKQLGKN